MDDDRDSNASYDEEAEQDQDVDETMEDADEAMADREDLQDGEDEYDEEPEAPTATAVRSPPAVIVTGDDDGGAEDPKTGAMDSRARQASSRGGTPRAPGSPGMPGADGATGDEDMTTKVEPVESAKAKSPTPAAAPAVTTRTWRPIIPEKILNATDYDIVPTMAAPMATSINAVALTPDLRFWMTGGSDGYVRKYHGPDTINGKQLLTVAQRHPFVDSVTKAGVLLSYWENAEPPLPGTSRGSGAGGAAHPRIVGGAGLMGGEAGDTPLSPVYSLAVHRAALWCLAGTEGGAINVFSVRHDEGKRITYLPSSYRHPTATTIHSATSGASDGLVGHRSAVSVLTLAPDEKSVLSGAWDARILDWDLNMGTVRRSFEALAGRGGQISAVELRPEGSTTVPVPREAEGDLWSSGGHGGGRSGSTGPGAGGRGAGWGEGYSGSGTMASTNGAAPRGNPGAWADGTAVDGSGAAANGADGGAGGPGAGQQGSPGADSLFGGGSDAGSLFGDGNEDGVYDDDFARALQDTSGQAPPMDAAGMDAAAASTGGAQAADAPPSPAAGGGDGTGAAQTNGLGDGAGQMDTQMTLDAGSGVALSPPNDASTPQAAQAAPSAADQTMTDAEPFQAGGPDGKTATSSTDDDGKAEAEASTGAGGTDSAAPVTVVIDTPGAPAPASTTTFYSAAIDGTIRIWDRRVPDAVARIQTVGRVAPWCMGACWSPDGNWIYAGRRNNTVEEFSIHKARGVSSSAGGNTGWTEISAAGIRTGGVGLTGWQPTRIFKFPTQSGPVSAVRPMPNGRHIVCASHDILRLWDLKFEETLTAAQQGSAGAAGSSLPDTGARRVPFVIIPGAPRPGVISSLVIDPTCRFMVSAAGTRGWEGTCTECLIGYEIGVVN